MGIKNIFRMNSFKALYGRICYTPISWSDPMNRVLNGPYMLAYMEQEIQVIKKNLKASQDRKKSYEYQNRFFKEF